MLRHLPLTLFLASLSPLAAQEPYTFRRPCMGTVWTLKLYAPDEKAATAAADAAFARVDELNKICSDYLPDSELSRLSATAGTGEAVTLSGDLLTVLRRSQTAAAESGGLFDITIGPSVQLWRTARKTKQLPSPEKIAAAQQATGWSAVKIDGKVNTVKLEKPSMRLDLGGIAKGFAQDEALAVIRANHQIQSALIDAGGAVAVSGKPPGRAGWNVSIIKTSETDHDLILQLQNATLATSGDLNQAVEINGIRYSHIIDKSTGLGMTTPTQASVVAPNATDADWLATTLCLMGPEKGIAWLAKTHPEAEARVSAKPANAEPTIAETKGFRRLLLKQNTTPQAPAPGQSSAK